MGNVSIQPTVPATNGTGLPTSAARLGLEKTIYIDGTFTGIVTIEAATGRGFCPVASFDKPGRKVVDFVAEEIRIVRSAATAVPGTPVVTVSANEDGGQFLDMAVGSPGASIDMKDYGNDVTVVVDVGVGELTLTGQPLDTETVVIGDKTYTFQTVLTDVDGNVAIGGTAAASLQNLIAAINLGAGSGSAYAASMTANTQVQAKLGSTSLKMEAVALDSRGTLRGIATTETLTNGSWATTIMARFIDGVVKIQTSEDDTTWTDLCSFQVAGAKTLEVSARYVRANHVNNSLTTAPTASIGASNDDSAQREYAVVAPDANINLEADLSATQEITLDQNVVIDDIINAQAGDLITLVVKQDGGGGNTLTFPAEVLWPGGTAPTITVAGSAIDEIRITVTAVDASGVVTEALGRFSQAFA